LILVRRRPLMANHKTIQSDATKNTWTLQGAEGWWSNTTEYQREMFDFMSHRFEKNSVALQGLGECRNWEEVSILHSKWLQDMSKDYAAETTKVIAIYTKQAADAAQERRSRH
jgi:hypothetical protein